MPVIVEEPGESLSDRTEEGEVLVHTHYHPQIRCAVTLFIDKEDDESYDGEIYECELCGFAATYDDVPESFNYIYFSYIDETYKCGVCDYTNDREDLVKEHWVDNHKLG